jgi:hypothetical protein
VLLTICCGVTLFHPHPFGAGLKASSANPDVPIGNRVLVIKMNF